MGGLSKTVVERTGHPYSAKLPRPVQVSFAHPSSKYNCRVNPGRLALSVVGLAGSGVLLYLGLKSTGTIEVERAQGASFVMDTFTLSGTKENFIRGIMSAAARVDPSLSPQTRLLLAVWAAHESGWGKTKQAQKAFNLWNVTAGSSWLNANKPTMDGGDTEFSEGSKDAKRIVQKWRVYGSLDLAVQDILSFLKNSGYVNYREAYTKLLNGDPTFVTTLGVFERGATGNIVRVDTRTNSAGFYTLPRSEYQKSTNKLLAEGQAVVVSGNIAGLMAGTQS